MEKFDSIIVEFDLKQQQSKVIALENFAMDMIDDQKIYWVHCDLSHPDHLDQLKSILNLPDEIIELCHESDPMPKLIDQDTSLAIQIQCVIDQKINYHEVMFGNLIIYLTERFCFTAASEPLLTLSEFLHTYPQSIRYAKTPCFILFLLFDDAINDYSKILFEFELITERMDVHVHSEHKDMFQEVMDVKQQVMRVKRYAIAAREILMRISGRNISVISEQCRSSLNNLSSHTHMIVHEADSIRDMLNGLLSQIENSLMQRMSETMRILTVFASIFLPLTLITGIYGMNFVWIPELHWKYGYFYALSLLFICGLLLLFIFKKMKWF